uniref:GG15532 n=1 Tax=Drosophila erecta TaxID=7220 RepID=B3P1S8_DROER
MDNFQNDVALLILEQWFKLDDYINVICLPEHEAYPPPKSQCYANGWGKDGFADLELFNGIMKRIPLHTVNYSSSFNVFHGDGGGPLACPFGNPQENRYQLTGILISLVRCNSDWTVVTANVAWVRNWIDQEITAIGFDKSYYSAGSSLLTN